MHKFTVPATCRHKHHRLKKLQNALIMAELRRKKGENCDIFPLEITSVDIKLRRNLLSDVNEAN